VCSLLDISACHIEAGLSYAIANLIVNSTSVEVLNIGFNRLRGNGGSIIFGALEKNVVLKKLDLSGNMLSSNFLSDEILYLTPSIEELNLGQNSIGDKGLSTLIDTIKNNTSIKRLYLDLYNKISDVGAARIADLLLENTNTSLVYIDLSGNSISDEGAKLLVKALSARSRAGRAGIEIKLSGNKVSAPLLQQLREAGAGAIGIGLSGGRTGSTAQGEL
jgi:hypothetical protein